MKSGVLRVAPSGKFFAIERWQDGAWRRLFMRDFRTWDEAEDYITELLERAKQPPTGLRCEA